MLVLSLDDLDDVLTGGLDAFPVDLEDLGELTVSLDDLDTFPVDLEDPVLTASLEGLDVLTASLVDLELLLLFTVFPDSVLLELLLFTEASLLELFELLSECSLV